MLFIVVKDLLLKTHFFLLTFIVVVYVNIGEGGSYSDACLT